MSDDSSVEVPFDQAAWDFAYYHGFIAETVAFALYCALFVFTMIKWRKVSQNGPLFALTVLLFLTCAAHYGTTVYPVYLQNISVNGLTYLSIAPNTTYLLTSSVFFALANLFGDMTMLYRLWNFYQRRYIVVALPSLLSFAGFVLYVTNTVLLVSGPDGFSAIDEKISMRLNIAGYTLPLLTNLIVTTCIVGRTWSMVKRQGDETISTPARRAIATIVESGLLYFLMQLLVTIANALLIPSATPITFVTVQIYGIAPTLITAGINSGILFTSKGGVPSVTGPLATTHINVNKDSYVMTHLSENWSEFDQDSHRDKESLAARDDKSLVSAISVDKL